MFAGAFVFVVLSSPGGHLHILLAGQDGTPGLQGVRVEPSFARDGITGRILTRGEMSVLCPVTFKRLPARLPAVKTAKEPCR